MSGPDSPGSWAVRVSRPDGRWKVELLAADPRWETALLPLADGLTLLRKR